VYHIGSQGKDVEENLGDEKGGDQPNNITMNNVHDQIQMCMTTQIGEWKKNWENICYLLIGGFSLMSMAQNDCAFQYQVDFIERSAKDTKVNVETRRTLQAKETSKMEDYSMCTWLEEGYGMGRRWCKEQHKRHYSMCHEEANKKK